MEVETRASLVRIDLTNAHRGHPDHQPCAVRAEAERCDFLIRLDPIGKERLLWFLYVPQSDDTIEAPTDECFLV